MNRYKLHLYWGKRQKTILDLGHEISDFLIQLYNFDEEIFNNWGILRNNSVLEIGLEKQHTISDINLLISHLILEDNLNDIKKQNVEINYNFSQDTGFVISLRKEKVCVIRLIIGTNNDYLTNVVTIQFEKGFTKNYKWFHDLFLLTINMWNPDYGLLTESALSQILNADITQYSFGWMNYFSNKLNIKINDIEGTTNEEFKDGKIIIATKEIFTRNNQNHIESVTKLFNSYSTLKKEKYSNKQQCLS